jgi:hypothetical protein
MLKKLLTLGVCLWTGAVLAIAFIAAPAAFAALPSADAGLVAARLFRVEAFGTMMVGTVAWIVMRREAAQASRDWPLWVAVLFAMMTTLIGYFGLVEQMQSAKAANNAALYARLHGVSMVAYAIKTIAWASFAAMLVWRKP